MLNQCRALLVSARTLFAVGRRAGRLSAISIAALALLVPAGRAGAAPALGEVKANAPRVACFDRFEVSFPLAGDFRNPFDPREIQVDGRFRRPDGREVVMPGFLYQECRRSLSAEGAEVVEMAGDPLWKIRFAPTVPGKWRLVVRARDKAGTSESAPLQFEATPSRAPGVVRLAGRTGYFRYEDGTPFFPIGENIAWAGKKGTYDFDQWLPSAGKAGMNLARIWLQWNNILSIETKRSGAGRYDLANAWRMDYVLDLARQSGVRVLFTCDSPEPYQKEHYWLGKLTAKPWENCPHNVANGGPLKEAAEFYTTEAGHQLIRQRLRYIVARWGWDPNIFCWELWNELNCFPGWGDLVPEIARWHVEMAGVLRDLDPYRHLVTTSFGNADGHPDIWKLPELDFTQSHCYAGRDMASFLPAVTRAMRERYDRPHLIGEFGTSLTADILPRMGEIDPTGVHLRNGLWSTVLSGAAGTPLLWWWDNYVHPKNLYPVFTALGRFCDGVPWPTAGFQPVRATASWIKPPAPRPPRDLVLDCQGQSLAGTVAIDPGAPPASLGRFYLYGAAAKEQQKPILLELDRKEAGPLLLRIGRVWVLGLLEVKLDGKPVLNQGFPAGPGEGPWKKSELDKRWNIWGADYDKEISLEIPAGKHTVELYNAGKDGITIDRVTLPRYLSDQHPPVRRFGLAGKGLALLWFQNSEHTFAALMEKREVLPVEGARVTVAGIPAGPCRVEWWDTKTGHITRTTQERAGADGLVLDLPALPDDVAVKVRW